MESNKENVSKFSSTSKIPIPKDYLPQLPSHLKTRINDLRQPLKTLNNQDAKHGAIKKAFQKSPPDEIQYGAIKKKPQKTPKIQDSENRNTLKKKVLTPKNVDSKYVTVRKDLGKLDWNLKVFSNCVDDSVITISDDENTETVSSKTPSEVNVLTNNRIKNIKQSLKRPHSREIQGVSDKEKCNDNLLKRNVNPRKEKIIDLLDLPDKQIKKYAWCNSSTDLFKYLLHSERRPLGVPRIPSITRACIINWLMKVNGPDGDPSIIQSTCWYLDSILAKRSVRLEKLQLVATACYWIAQKLLSPPMSANRLIKYSDHAFASFDLRHAERTVLMHLDFPRQPIVAQEFIGYLVWNLGASNPGEIEVSATYITLSGIMVNPALACEYPSVIAAAAVRNSLMLLMKDHLVPMLFMNPVYKQAESKARDFRSTCSAQRIAIRTVANPKYEYRVPYDYYLVPPYNLSKRISAAAKDCAMKDSMNLLLDNQI